MLLVALLTTVVAVAQTDTATVKGEQLEEIVVNANNAQRRLNTVLTGGQSPCEVDAAQTLESLSFTGSDSSFWIIASSWKGCCLRVVRTSLAGGK